jgi:2-amino-4-hydroxy-6-hydroxymethyldihydropteridine diphosphokinase
MKKCCFIALGSNLNNPLQQVTKATLALSHLPNSQLVAISPWYQSDAIGPGKQDNYINGVVQLSTELPAHDLLKTLQQIEHDQHRVRIQHWGPRTLDLDLLLYADSIIATDTLTVPHPRMLERNFVLYPLYAIAPELILPDGSNLKHHYQQCNADNLTHIDTNTITNQTLITEPHCD